MKRSLGIQWEFAILLIVLFGIAAIGVWSVLSFLSEHLAQPIYTVVAVLIWTLAMGFMLIAGAFGLWAIRFAAEVESRRRIGQLVDAMDYISDGLLAVNDKSRIVGSNPAARRITRSELSNTEDISTIFPCLSTADILHLFKSHEPAELEREIVSEGKSQTLRFRAQPSGDVVLLMVSDITAINAKRQLARQSARLQLLGQLARGVAHDFSQVLSTISTHAALLPRLTPGTTALEESTQAILRASQRGATLADHLLQLSQARVPGKYTRQIDEHIRNAELLLRDSIPYGWSIEATTADSIPPVPLSGSEIEQMILNLGLLLTELYPDPRRLRLIASPPHAAKVFNVDPRYACVVLMTAVSNEDDGLRVGLPTLEPSRETGIILSVIRSMLEEVGGRVDELFSGTGAPAFRLILPHTARVPAPVGSGDAQTSSLDPALIGLFKGNNFVFAAPATTAINHLIAQLQHAGIRCRHTTDVTATLAELEPERGMDGIFIDRPVLGSEAVGLIRAMLKLKPSAAFVVLSDDTEGEPVDLRADVVFVDDLDSATVLLHAFREARNLASRRTTKR